MPIERVSDFRKARVAPSQPTRHTSLTFAALRCLAALMKGLDLMTRAAKPLLVALCAALCSCSEGGPRGVDYTSMDKTLGRWPKMQQSTKPSMVELPAQDPADPLDAATDEPDHASDEDAGAEDEMPSGTPNTGGSVKSPA